MPLSLSKASQYFAAQDPPVEKINDAGAEIGETPGKNQRQIKSVQLIAYQLPL